jgi:hypothetical protein
MSDKAVPSVTPGLPPGHGATAAPEHGGRQRPGSDASFWRHPTVEELAAEQGVKPVDEATLDAMQDVWPADESIDEFLAWLREIRQQGKGDA